MSQKKKILHIIQSLDNGGCENMLLRTLPLLDDFEHTIITLKELGNLAPKFLSTGIPVKTVHCNHLFDIPGIQRLRKATREERPDVIITYLFHADILGRCVLRTATEAPVIPFLRTTYNHPKYFIARILEWFTKPLVTHYLANSAAVKDFYIKHLGVKQEKITTIPNGIDTEYFNSLLPHPELRESLGIKQDNFVITCVANLVSNKGHRYLLEAFESIFQKYPKCSLLIVGEGPERKNTENQIKNYQSKNNIFLLGRRTDIVHILKISDCFVLPTLFEGMSNALLEAMAARLPIITTDIPENRILLKNFSTGLLVEPKNATALASAMKNIVENESLAEKLSHNAYSAACESYSLQSIKKLWNNFLSSL